MESQKKVIITFQVGDYMFFVYVLNSLSRNYIYVGLTNNVPRRVSQHQEGREKTTAPYRPFKCIYVEEFYSRQEAREREKYLKSGIGKEWIKKNFKK